MCAYIKRYYEITLQIKSKYKLLMPYGQGVECLHLPTIFR